MAKDLKIDLYDFDKTIYRGDSSIDFYLFCVQRNKALLRFAPSQIFHFVLYVLRIEPKRIFKGNFFKFILSINDLENQVKNFWQIQSKKIQPWFPVGDNKFVVVSASPSFLLEAKITELGAYKLIATEIDTKTGKLIGENCYGREKVVRIKKELPEAAFESAYSDSVSDLPMLLLASRGYIVKKSRFSKIER